MQTRRLNGASVKAVRVAIGVSLNQLGKDTDLNPGFLSRLESGKRQASPTTIAVIARRLGVPIDAITNPHGEEAA